MPPRDFNSDVGEAEYLVSALVASYPGDLREVAITKTADAVGISPWTAWGIFYGRRKAIGHAALTALRREYLRLCDRQIRHFVAEADEFKERCGENDTFQDIATAAEAVVARLRNALDKED